MKIKHQKYLINSLNKMTNRRVEQKKSTTLTKGHSPNITFKNNWTDDHLQAPKASGSAKQKAETAVVYIFITGSILLHICANQRIYVIYVCNF